MPKFYVSVEWPVFVRGFTVIEAESKADAVFLAQDQIRQGGERQPGQLGRLPFPNGGPEILWPAGWQGAETFGGGMEWDHCTPRVLECDRVTIDHTGLCPDHDQGEDGHVNEPSPIAADGRAYPASLVADAKMAVALRGEKPTTKAAVNFLEIMNPSPGN